MCLMLVHADSGECLHLRASPMVALVALFERVIPYCVPHPFDLISHLPLPSLVDAEAFYLSLAAWKL
jgi:hypothetical protein